MAFTAFIFQKVFDKLFEMYFPIIHISLNNAPASEKYFDLGYSILFKGEWLYRLLK